MRVAGKAHRGQVTAGRARQSKRRSGEPRERPKPTRERREVRERRREPRRRLERRVERLQRGLERERAPRPRGSRRRARRAPRRTGPAPGTRSAATSRNASSEAARTSRASPPIATPSARERHRADRQREQPRRDAAPVERREQAAEPASITQRHRERAQRGERDLLGQQRRCARRARARAARRRAPRARARAGPRRAAASGTSARWPPRSPTAKASRGVRVAADHRLPHPTGCRSRPARLGDVEVVGRELARSARPARAPCAAASPPAGRAMAASMIALRVPQAEDVDVCADHRQVEPPAA